jgi:uncharacterized linocin/CFP29 family protein
MMPATTVRYLVRVDHLLRSIAPISDLGWKLLDDEAKDRLTPALGARRLVDFTGPLGWQHSATILGRVAALASSPAQGVSAKQRRVLPLVELRAAFEVDRGELFATDRGADDADLATLDAAAHQIAQAENIAVLHGWEGAIDGITQVTPQEPIALGDAAKYPAKVAHAVEQLLAAGVGGPYGIALGNEAYRLVLGGSDSGGYPLADHLAKILGGPVVWAPGVNGAVVLSLRGGDFVFESGQDLSIGYDSHAAETVALYLEESFSFHVATPEAAVALTP